ncbi:unnamed protein product [Thelazia callipaeda]|uniref:Poly [ADP-ribose] polymerase n=1 Tax=Thelazia callipaeda TaxID=103827 RepID=A0A158RCM9_THECL|nr:unnamed protein product [Thelazia callipaeda]
MFILWGLVPSDKNDKNDAKTASDRKEKVRRTNSKKSKLRERSGFEYHEVNPYLYSSKDLKFVSVASFSRINAHRFVVQKKIDSLLKMAYDNQHFNITALEWPFCPALKMTAEAKAILAEDQNLLKLIFDLKNDTKVSRAELEPVMLSQQSCGTMNIHMLGHATATIGMTRGGREGINALLNDDFITTRHVSELLQVFIRCNISFTTLSAIKFYYSLNLAKNIYRAVRYGHRQLAANMIESFAKYNFNDLHILTLKNNSEPLKKFTPISVTKKGRLNRNITPLHTVAINPNVNYLEALLATGQQCEPDLDGWDLIHYAAVCEGPGPLKHLLSLGVSPLGLTKKKQLPLHCAVRAGRLENVEILIEAMQNLDESIHSEQMQSGRMRSQKHSQSALQEIKEQKQSINRNVSSFLNAKISSGKTALYIAASRGHVKIVEALLNVSTVMVDIQTSASKKKLTPLMIACARGYLEVANVLIDMGMAAVEKGDKLKRTSLSHAVINGQVHVVAMLLRRGCNPLLGDSSGNAPAHYAAAFGWLECLILLAKADANSLSAKNDWHLTPFSIAYMKGISYSYLVEIKLSFFGAVQSLLLYSLATKGYLHFLGHYGIVEWLVDGPYSNYVDINSRDYSGATLLISVIKSYCSFTDKRILAQLQFLIGKGADCSLKDSSSYSPLHYFCTVSYQLKVENSDVDFNKEANEERLTKDEYRSCFNLLIANSMDLFAENKGNALYLAVNSGNLYLAELIFDEIVLQDSAFHSLKFESSVFFFHSLISLPFKIYNNRSLWSCYKEPAEGQYNIIPLLDKLILHDEENVRQWLWEKNQIGLTPLLLLCREYLSAQNKICSHEEDIFCGRFVNTICDVVHRLISLDSRIIFQNDTFGISATSYSAVDKTVQNKVEYDHKVELLNQSDNDGYTPLLRMVSSNNLSMSMYLLHMAHSVISEESENKVDSAAVKFRYCPKTKRYFPWNKSVLMFAVENGMIELIEELVLTSAEWNAHTGCGDNAFHFAAKFISLKSAALYELLKRKGVELKANEEGRYPLHIVVASLSKTSVDIFTEPLDWFLNNEKGIFDSDKNGCLPLHYCFIPLKRNISKQDSIDPISILTVLLSAMQSKNMIDKADDWGFTALHYAALFGANICIVSLLQAGANQNLLNNDGNTPLALAVHFTKNEKTSNNQMNKWIWIPLRTAAEGQKPVATIPSLIVRNEWQGVVYVLLIVMGKNVHTTGCFVRAALEYRKYNFAQTMLEMFYNLLKVEQVDKALFVLDELDFFKIFVENLISGSVDENIMKLMKSLLQFGCKWYNRQNDLYQSSVIECLASRGYFQFLHALHDLDQKTAHPVWNSINYELTKDNPLVGVIETWIKNVQFYCSGSDNDTKYWLKHFAAKFGINSLMQYKRPAFYGMYPCLPKQPVPEFCYMTPLIRAIQCSNTSLVDENCNAYRFLLRETDLKTDVNKADELGITPLMHACMVNSEEIILLLFNPDSLEQESIRQQKSIPNSSGTSVWLLLIGKYFNGCIVRPKCVFNKNFLQTSLACTSVGIGGLFGGFGNYSDAIMHDDCVNDRQPLSRKRKIKEKEINPVRKFDLQSSLNLFKQTNAVIDGLANVGTRNFVHFMLEPCGWQNTDLLQAIGESNPEIKSLIKQSSSQDTNASPLHIARERHQIRMLETMKALCRFDNSDFRAEYPPIDVSSIKTSYDIDGDCELFLSSDAEGRQKQMKHEFMKSFLKPHKNSGYDETGKICFKPLEDSEPVPYKVIFLFAFILLERKNDIIKKIGDATGQYQRTPFSTLDEADKEFTNIFRSKTGNEFMNIKNFIEKPTKYRKMKDITDVVMLYRLVKVNSDTSGDIADLKIDLDKSSAIDYEAAKCSTYQLIKDISDVKRLQKRTRMICHIKRSRVPFGCICRSDLLKAQNLLLKLRNLNKEMRNCYEMSESPETVLKIFQAQSETTNEFYKLVFDILMPLGGFENSALGVIDNESSCEIFEKVIEGLLHMEIAGKIVTAAAFNMNHIDPYMYITNALECKLSMLDPDDLTSQRILQYIHISSDCSVRAIYEIKSREAAEQFNAHALHIKNHRYLWHGTKSENMLSILKVGLLPSPSFVERTGQAFGQGIYFADSFEKSSGYSTASTSGVKYIMLCQVALGEIFYGASSQPVRNNVCDESSRYHSLKVVGYCEPDPHYDLTMEDGTFF